MKKIYCIFLVLTFFCIGNFSAFNAEICLASTVYARAETSTVGFYASELDETPMFYLPIGYYVTITGETGEFYSCEYAKTESYYTKKYGFVKISEVVIDEEMALPLFPEIAITAIKDTNLYSKQNKATVLSSITAGQKAYFYGIYTDGDTSLYYVKISNDFGYVETSGFEQLVIPTHPKLITQTVVENETLEDVVETFSDEDESIILDSDIQIAMILCVSLPALVVLFYIFKPQSDQVSRYFES